jgi:hypothetical protein
LVGECGRRFLCVIPDVAPKLPDGPGGKTDPSRDGLCRDPGRPFDALRGQSTEDGVHKAPFARGNEPDGFGYGSVVRDPGVQKLVGAHAQSCTSTRWRILKRLVEKGTEGMVDGKKPSERPVGQFGGQLPIHRLHPGAFQERRESRVRKGPLVRDPANNLEGEPPG